MRRVAGRIRALLLVVASCAQLGHAVAAPPATVIPGGSPSAAGFADALEPRSFAFPRDHGPHPEFRQEWWYVTGNLDATDGERFGFELTFFRVALVPPRTVESAALPATTTASSASAWRAREIYVAHFAVTDVARQRFRSEQKLSRAALGLAGAQAVPLHVWLDDWALKGSGSSWELHATQPGYSIDLTLEPQSAPVLNGEAGLSRKSDQAADATYYYSMPRLDVRGRLLTDADVSIAVEGEWRNGAGDRYPAGWRIRVPALSLDLNVRPVLADQELQTTPRYWEGAVDVSGERAGTRLGGRGYVELVGYAQER